MEFGARLRELRRGKCLSQEELARDLGVAMMTVSRYERGEHLPTLTRLRHIAEYFDVEPGDLLGSVDGSRKARKVRAA